MRCVVVQTNSDMTAINPRTVESFQANALVMKRKMKMYRGIEVYIHAFSTVELYLTARYKSVHYLFNRRFGRNIEALLDRNISRTPGI
jgi:hypothetical protein